MPSLRLLDKCRRLGHVPCIGWYQLILFASGIWDRRLFCKASVGLIMSLFTPLILDSQWQILSPIKILIPCLAWQWVPVLTRFNYLQDGGSSSRSDLCTSLGINQPQNQQPLLAEVLSRLHSGSTGSEEKVTRRHSHTHSSVCRL